MDTDIIESYSSVVEKICCDLAEEIIPDFVNPTSREEALAVLAELESKDCIIERHEFCDPLPKTLVSFKHNGICKKGILVHLDQIDGEFAVVSTELSLKEVEQFIGKINWRDK